MIHSFYLKLLTFINIILLAQAQDSNSNSEIYAYSPLYLNFLTSSDKKWTPLHTSIAQKSGLVFVASGFSGITITDQVGSQILYQQNLGSKYVNHIQSSSDGQHIFVSFENSLMVLQMQYNQQQEKTSIINSTQLQKIVFKDTITQLLYKEDDEFLIISCFGGLIAAYDTKDKQKLIQIGSISLQAQKIGGLFLTQNKQWLYVAGNISGIFIIKIKDTQQDQQNNSSRAMNFIQAGYGHYAYLDNFCVATSDGFIYAFDVWQGFFLSNAQIVAQGKESEYPITVSFKKYWPFQTSPTMQSITINQEETLLFLGVRSQGIYVFDIRQRENLKIFQQIKIDSLAYFIAFSKNEEYLYLSGASSLLTFQKTEMNLNNDFPNLFNTHQIKFDKLLSLPFKQKCYTDKSNSYLVGAFQQNIIVFPINQDPYRLNISDYQKYDIQANSIQLEDSGYLIVPSYFSAQQIKIFQYNSSNNLNQQNVSLMNMSLVKQYQSNTTKVSEMIAISQDKTFAVQTYQTGLILYNSTDLFNMQIYCYYQYLDNMIGQNQGAGITRDNKWVLSTVRDFGVYLLNVENKTNPFLADYAITQGGENIILSQFQNYAYLIDGFQGLAIIDINFFPKINIISRINLNSYVFMGLLIQNEQYILITQENNILITLIDIRNKKYPQVFNTVNYQSQSGQAVCMPQTQDHLFITSQAGIITIPIFSDVKIHTDINLITNNFQTGLTQVQRVQKQSYNNLIEVNNEYIFEVGQVIQLNFNIIYPAAENMLITKVYLYQDQKIMDLPSFFLFSIFEQQIQMNIDKQLLGKSQSQINMNFILLWTEIQITKSSFIFTSQNSDDQAITNSTQSALIYQYLQDLDIIDSNNFLSKEYNSQQGVILSPIFQEQLINRSNNTQQVYNIVIQQIAQKINLVLQRSCYVNPIKFYVKSSIFFDNQNSQKFISTIKTDDITVILQVSRADGKIVQVSHSIVTAFMSVNQDQLKIQGSLDNVNDFLKSKIIFANNTLFDNQNPPYITITIQDNINYPLVKKYNIYECNFVAIKKQLKLNPNNTLQQQVENQFKDAVIDIESSILFSFSQNTFQVEDAQDLSYQYYYQDLNEEYILIPSYLWLQQNNQNLSFKGQTTKSQYRLIYKFKIVASDGYTTAEDYFYLKVYGVPYQYVFNLLWQILGPIFALLGFYKYRSKFVNMYMYSKVTFSEDFIEVGQAYHKEIILLGNVQQVSKRIIDELFIQIQKKHSIQTTEASQLSENGNQQQKQNFENNSNNNKSNLDKNILKIHLQKDLFKIALRFSKLEGHCNYSKIEKRYLDNKGKLLFTKVIEDIKNLKIQPDKDYEKSYQYFTYDIKNTDKRMYRALRAQVSWQFLKYDKRTKQMYSYIKAYCLKILKKEENDWFKSLVQITHQTEKKQGLVKDFPKLEIKYNVLFKIFESLQLLWNKSKFHDIPNTFKQFTQYIIDNQVKVNLYLLREVIISETLGFQDKNPSALKPSCSGLSIHVDTTRINQICAYKRKKMNKWQNYIFSLLNNEYTAYPISKNRKLPSWLSVDLKYGKIILFGEPSQSDSEIILIKIFDIQGYCIYQYKLTVKLNDQKQNQSLYYQNINSIFTPKNCQYQQSVTNLFKSFSQNFLINNLKDQESVRKSIIEQSYRNQEKNSIFLNQASVKKSIIEQSQRNQEKNSPFLNQASKKNEQIDQIINK